MVRARLPTDVYREARSARAAAEPEPLPPRAWVTGLFGLLMLSWVLAFSATPMALVTVPAVIGLLAVVERPRTLLHVILWLLVFGALATAIGYSWLATTVQQFGGVGAALSWLLVAFFGVIGMAHGWVFAVIYRSMQARGRRPHPLIGAALLVACETLPIRLFAWGGGNGAVDVPPLLQAAEWGGVAGVSLALYCLVFPIYEWLRWAFVRTGAPARPVAAAVTFAVGLGLFGFGALRHQQVGAEDEQADAHLRVAIAQANIGRHLKRKATHDRGQDLIDSIAAFRSMTEKAAKESPDLIVWPETAITAAVPIQDPLQTNTFLRGIQGIGYDFINEIGKDRAFLVGMYEQVTGRVDVYSGKRLRGRYNVAALRQSGGLNAPWEAYRKVHLIPFGETMPLGIMEDSLPHKFPMVAGVLPQDFLTLEGREVTLAPFICYEGILADHVREYVAGKRPDILVSLANDSWFGGSWEPYQHLNFTRFRAVEHRAPLVRSTNTGISAFVAATGEVIATIGVGERDAIVRDVPLVEREPTIYVRFGHRLPLALWIVVLAAWFLSLLLPPPIGRE